MRGMKLLFGCVAMLVACGGQVQAGVIITYQDVGSDLHFDYEGSLDVDAYGGPLIFRQYSVVRTQSNGQDAIFYSSERGSYSLPNHDDTVTHTAGPFATKLSSSLDYSSGTASGTRFLFRLNDGIPGPARSIEIWGDWGAANAQIRGKLIINGQSADGIGMVDGWTAQTKFGSITFQSANTGAVPEPTSFAIFGLGALGFAGGAIRRCKKQQT